MKKLLFTTILAGLTTLAYCLNITIIESRSANSGHDMDLDWQAVATLMGHTPTIMPQATLDNNAFFATTDILIVSSGTITLPANRVATIQQFLQTGKPVYLQSEYQASYTTNQGFASIVNALGGSFTWGNLVSGDLNPMVVLGNFATTNLTIAPLSYYWYSTAGTGDCSIVPFLSYGNQHHGWQFIPPNPAWGNLVTTTDQDWVKYGTGTFHNLLQNIITNMINPVNTNSGSGSVNLGNDTTLCGSQTMPPIAVPPTCGKITAPMLRIPLPDPAPIMWQLLPLVVFTAIPLW